MASPALSYSQINAETLLNQEKYSEALSCLNQAQIADPRNADLQLDRVLAYLGLKQLGAALEAADNYLSLAPNSAKAFCMRGIVYEQMGKHDKAVADFSSAIHKDPSYTLAYRNRESAYLHWGKFNKGLADCEKVLR
jgi:tetratricopeptide (TPR) repeat protein